MKPSAGWIAAAILFGVVLILAICGKPKEQYTKYDIEVLEKRIKDTAESYRRRLMYDFTLMSEAAANRMEQAKELQASKEQLAASRSQIERLTKKIKLSRREIENDTWVKVSPNYKEGCDSLVIENQTLGNLITTYNEESAEAYKLMMYDISIRDSAINAQKDFNRKFMGQLDDCMGQLDDCMVQLDDCMVQLQTKKGPRTQVYAGVGLFGNQINPLAGGQVNISLKTKNNQIYEITGATVGNMWYGGVGTKFLLSFGK
jgi:hypothetical protein